MPVWITPVEITPGTADAWVDCDVSTYVPAGATGVILHVVVTVGAVYDFSFRKNGSTDARVSRFSDTGTGNSWVAVGVDTNRVLELYLDDITNMDVYLVGYYGSEAAFFTNAPNKSLSTTAAWTDIDISADTGAETAIAAVFDISGSETAYYFGLRKNGSTDARTYYNRFHDCPCFVIGVDASEICEGYIDNLVMDFFLLGYIKSSHTFNTNATDLSLSTLAAWLDLAALPSGATGGYIEVPAAYGPYLYGLRKNGSVEDIYQTTGLRVAFGIVECDASQIIEGKIEIVRVDFFLVGYATAAAGGAPKFCIERLGLQPLTGLA